nr:hypothetical protein [Tanacetum cinerariifolium]
MTRLQFKKSCNSLQEAWSKLAAPCSKLAAMSVCSSVSDIVPKTGDQLASSSARTVSSLRKSTTKAYLRLGGRIRMDLENSEGKWKVTVEYESERTSTKVYDAHTSFFCTLP